MCVSSSAAADFGRPTRSTFLRVQSIRDFGIYLDSDARHVSSYFRVLLQVRSIRRSVTRSVVQSLNLSLLMSRVDYGSATLAGLLARLLHRLQSVLHTAVQLVYGSRKFDHVTPLLRDLHWLRIPERIAFRLAVLTYCCLHRLAPPYLAGELHRVADVESQLRLRSASTVVLIVPATVTTGECAFPVPVTRIWSSIPQLCNVIAVASSLSAAPEDGTFQVCMRSCGMD